VNTTKTSSIWLHKAGLENYVLINLRGGEREIEIERERERER